MKLTKRLLCMLLAIVLLIGIVPTSVFASGDEAASSAASPPGAEAAATSPPGTTAAETAPETAPETTPETTGEPSATTSVLEESDPEAIVSSEAQAQEESALGLLTGAAYAVERAALTYTGTLGLFQRANVDFNGNDIWVDGKTKDHMYILGLRDLSIQWGRGEWLPGSWTGRGGRHLLGK